MIDIEKPIAENTENQNQKKHFPKKILITLLILVVVAILGFFLWLALRTSITVELAAGETYEFRNLQIKVENVTSDICQDVEGFVCDDWMKEDGANLRITNIDTKSMSFEYLGEKTRALAENDNATLELVDADSAAQTIKVKVTAK